MCKFISVLIVLVAPLMIVNSACGQADKNVGGAGDGDQPKRCSRPRFINVLYLVNSVVLCEIYGAEMSHYTTY